MSNQHKKQSDKPSGTPSQDPIVVRGPEGVVSHAELEALAAVSADNPNKLAMERGDIPFHTLCGSHCEWELLPRPGGHYFFGCYCPKCARSLMEGEIWYADYSKLTSSDSTSNG